LTYWSSMVPWCCRIIWSNPRWQM